MKKVLIIGCPGSGKSVLSRSLHEITGLPVTHLDNLHWHADGTYGTRQDLMEKLTPILTSAQWIVDGNYSGTMAWRMTYCDTVIWLDYPLEVCLTGIEARKGKPRSDMAWTEPADSNDEELISLVKGFRDKNRPRIQALKKQFADKQWYVFHTREEAAAWMETLHEKHRHNF